MELKKSSFTKRDTLTTMADSGRHQYLELNRNTLIINVLYFVI